MDRTDGPGQIAGQLGEWLANEVESSGQTGLLGTREFRLPGQGVEREDDGQRHQARRMSAGEPFWALMMSQPP